MPPPGPIDILLKRINSVSSFECKIEIFFIVDKNGIFRMI